MSRKLVLVLCLIVGLALLAPLSAEAGRIGMKNETAKKCYSFKWQSVLWAKSEGKWIPDGGPKTQIVKPGETKIYDGVIDGISWVEYQSFDDATCDKSSSYYKRAWSTSAPAAYTRLSVYVDPQGQVSVRQWTGK